MNNTIKNQIVNYEQRLQQAMLESDTNTLDELLAPELRFTNHLGQILSKKDDLDAHQSGMLTIEELTLSDQHIQVIGDIAIVSVRADIVGSFAGNHSANNFQFTRIWALTPGGSWRVVVAHSSIIV